jgi:hypothetical protein
MKEIKKGTVLIAIHPCKMIYRKVKPNALIVGKEYVVDMVTSEEFRIKSEVSERHYFNFNDYIKYFKIKL